MINIKFKYSLTLCGCVVCLGYCGKYDEKVR